MTVTLERNGLIRRQAGAPTARKLADPKLARYQTVKTTVTNY